MRIAAIVAAPLALGIAAPAAAQQADLEDSVFAGDYLSVGFGAGYAPSYEGSDDYVVFPVPLVQGSFRGVKINPRNAGIALDFVPDPKDGVGLNAGISARLRMMRTGNTHDPVVNGLGKLDTAIEVGPTVGLTVPHLLNPYDSLTLSTDARWDVAGAYKGMVVDGIVNYFTPLSRGIAASWSVNTEWGDGKYTDYYYSISPTQSAASGLPAFDGSGGLNKLGTRLLLGVDLDGDLANGGLALVGAVGYARMLGDARRSPITSIRGSADQWFGAVGVGYTF